MDRATAKTRIQAMTAWDSRPALSDAQVEALVDLARRQDTSGRWPSDTAWDAANATYDLNRAAAEGWGWKAGLVAGDFTFSADGASYSKADVLAHCAEREAYYAGRVRGSMDTGAYRYGLAYGSGSYDSPSEELTP